MQHLTKINILNFLFAIAGFFIPLALHASEDIAGIVKTVDLEPVAQVTVDVAYGNREKKAVVLTATGGSFSFSLQQTFPGYEPRLAQVALTFRKEGYYPLKRVSECKPRGEVDCSNLEITLGRSESETELSEEDRQRLQALQSISGLTLYLLPYEIRNLSVADNVDLELLAQAIHRHVNSRFQELRQQAGVAKRLPTVGLRLLPDIEVGRTDTERMDAIGKYVKALALVGGSGHFQSGNEDRILLTSLYHVVPSTHDFQAGALYVDDLMAAEYLNSPLLFEALSDEWVLHTLIALSIQKLKEARKNKDINSLQVVRAYLIAKRSEYGEDEIRKVMPLTDLLELVNNELNRLGSGG